MLSEQLKGLRDNLRQEELSFKKDYLDLMNKLRKEHRKKIDVIKEHFNCSYEDAKISEILDYKNNRNIVLNNSKELAILFKRNFGPDIEKSKIAIDLLFPKVF